MATHFPNKKTEEEGVKEEEEMKEESKRRILQNLKLITQGMPIGTNLAN